jgi:hypothetical protein
MRVRRLVISWSVLLAAMVAGCAQNQGNPAVTNGTGAGTEVRFRLEPVGEVLVPASVPADERELDLLVHFHGAASIVEREFQAAGLKAVLITINYPGLSSAYESPFTKEPLLFTQLLDATLWELQKRGRVPPKAHWRTVAVSSFSAGFGAVRALLRTREHFDRIDALCLADTLYAGYLDAQVERRVDPADMQDFRQFARRATQGKKTLIISHSYLEPGKYAGTHETADDLLAFVNVPRQVVDEPGPAGTRVISRADAGGLHVWGVAGTTGDDHMAHLRNLRFWLVHLPLAR